MRILVCIMVMCVLLAGCGPLGKYEKDAAYPMAEESQEKNWTIMLYIAADIEKELAKVLTNELIDVLKIGSTNNCHIVTQIDLPGKKEEARRYYVLKEKLIKRGEYKGANMGNPDTLKGFLEWGMNYKAKKYCFIVMGHGTGWMSLSGPGSIADSLPQSRSFAYSHSDNDCITLEEFKGILNGVMKGKKLDVCAFNSCLMSQAEVAYQMKDYVKYMVAAETTMPGFGFDYPLLMKRVSTLDLSPAELANTVLESAESEYRKMKAMVPGLLKEIKTLDADWEENHYWEIKDLKEQVKTIRKLEYQVGVSNVEQVTALKDSVARFTAVWNKYMQEDRAKALEIAQAARARSKTFGDMFAQVYASLNEKPSDNNEYVDMDEFMLEVYDRTDNDELASAAQNVIENLYRVVVNTFNSDPSVKFTRISTYYPPSSAIYKRLTRKYYERIDWAKDTGWLGFIDSLME